MNQTRRALLPAALLLIACTLFPVKAQTNIKRAATDLLTLLPASDVVLVMEHGRILHEAIPRLFGNNRAPLAKIFAAGDEFKAKTGIDPSTVSRVVMSLRFVNPEAISTQMDKKEFALVIIAQGDFDASHLIDFLRRAEKDKVREQTYNGQLIYSLDERPKGSTQAKPDIETPAIAVLDANTFALGDLSQMRATVDARNGGERASPDLLALLTRNSNALISVAGNVPPSLAARISPTENTGNDEVDNDYNKFLGALASIKQTYISVGLTAGGLEALLGGRLGSAEQAASLSDMLIGARQKYSVFIEDKVIRELISGMQITAEGSDVQLRVEVPQTVITAMLLNANKPGAPPPAGGVSKATAKQTTTTTTGTPARKKTRRGTTRRKRG